MSGRRKRRHRRGATTTHPNVDSPQRNEDVLGTHAHLHHPSANLAEKDAHLNAWRCASALEHQVHAPIGQRIAAKLEQQLSRISLRRRHLVLSLLGRRGHKGRGGAKLLCKVQLCLHNVDDDAGRRWRKSVPAILRSSSPTHTRRAPIARHTAAVSRPTGPAPKTTTLLIGSTFPCRTAL